jgi:hypothetical protein
VADEPRNRFDRDVEVVETGGSTLTRYQHLDQELDLLTQRLKNGGVILEARAVDRRVEVSLAPKGGVGLTGRFPTFQLALTCLGEALDDNPLDQPEGECPGIEPIDQALLGGSELTVSRVGVSNSGTCIMAIWKRKLEPRFFSHKGKEHKVYRVGNRTAIKSGVLEAALRALDEEEHIREWSAL